MAILILWLAALVAAALALMLTGPRYAHLDHAGIAAPTPLNGMLVRLIAGVAVVFLFSLGLYAWGLVLPAVYAASLYVASRVVADRIDLVDLWRFRMLLALAALAVGIVLWLEKLAVKEPFHV